jgi:hypothetical protein
MAFNETVDFFGRVMRYFFDVSMAAFTFYLGMDTVIEDIFIDIKELHVAVSINDADTGILMSQETVAHVCSV